MSHADDDIRLVDHPLMPRVGHAVGGRYEILEVIGEGGFGAVYKARDLRAGGQLALKVLDPDKSNHPQFAKRFNQEVMVVRHLTHHNTIKIWDVGETESGCLFMAMEYLDGEPLSDLLEHRGALPGARVHRIGKQILLSLAEAHERGIVHRDLKPDNIMVMQPKGDPDYVKVLDFGIAKAFGGLSLVKTATGMVMCTPPYAAPELLRNVGVAPATDVYAVGLILIEMMTGEPAVAGDTAADVIVKQMSPDPVPIPPVVANSTLSAVIERAVSKDIGQRYPSAAPMLDDLVALGDTLSAPAQSAHPTRSATGVPPAWTGRLPRVGEVVAGRYRLTDRLGEGGFAVVFRARDERAGGELAVKVIDPRKGRHDKIADRFRQEVAVVRQLKHHNSIKIWDVGQTESGCLFMAMELVDGVPLDVLLTDQGPLAPERVVRIATQVLRSLAEAHAAGVVHRDLKPGNIMVGQPPGEPDYVKVLDFGIAKALEPALAMVKTQTGMIMCTPAYAAPELIRGREIGPRSDLYALGLIMLEMLTGRPVIQGSSVYEQVAAQMSPDPVSIPGDVASTALGQVIRRAVAKDPGHRVQSAEAMLEALRQLTGTGAPDQRQANPPGPPAQPASQPTHTTGMGGGPPATPTSLVAPSTGELTGKRGYPAPATTSSPAEPPTEAGKGGARWVKPVGLVAALVLAGVVAVALLTRGGGDGGGRGGGGGGGSAVDVRDVVLGHLAHAPRFSDSPEWDIDVTHPYDLPGLAFATAYDLKVMDGPTVHCVVRDDEPFCDFDGDLLERVVTWYDLSHAPSPLGEDDWANLLAFDFHAEPNAVYRTPEDLHWARSASPGGELIDFDAGTLHPPDVRYRDGGGVDIELFLNVFGMPVGWLELSRVRVGIEPDGRVHREIHPVYAPPPGVEPYDGPPGWPPTEPDQPPPEDWAAANQERIAAAQRAGLRGHHDEAIALLEEAQAFDPENARIALMLYRNLSAIGDTGNACRQLGHALELIPDDDQTRQLFEETCAELLEPSPPEEPGVNRIGDVEPGPANDIPAPIGLGVGDTLGGAIDEYDLTAQHTEEGQPVLGDRCRFELEQATRLRIEVGSDQFDTYLILLAEDGATIAEDDDGGRGTDSRIDVDLDRGPYEILVTSFDRRATGRYELALEARPERRPEVEAGRPDVVGALDAQIIRRVLAEHRREIMWCYELGLSDDPELSGRVVLGFTIDPSGRVAAVRISGGTLGDAVDDCLASTLRGLVFPAPRGGGLVEVRFPYLFQSGD